MSYRTCSFIKHDDVPCGSPALRGGHYCFHHNRQITDACYGARAHRRRYEVRFDLPALDNRRDIQDMLNYVFAHLCADTIDYRRADAMLRAIRMAERELDHPTQW
jgi:hypothetical protein